MKPHLKIDPEIAMEQDPEITMEEEAGSNVVTSDISDKTDIITSDASDKTDIKLETHLDFKPIAPRMKKGAVE